MMTATYATEIVDKSHTTVMRHGKFCASLMKAERLRDEGHPHSLPPGSPIPVYPVDALPGCPEEWVKGPGSYVCPVAPDWGLWFDWRGNDHLNTAVLPSVKGLNPITGHKIDGLRLRQFKDECPVHKTKFKGDERYCEKCGYQWPIQDYVASPNTLWWDGFRQPDGCVRQFFFSEDGEKDIASAIMGEKSTVPAFGFAFFRPKKERIPEAPSAPQWQTYISNQWQFNEAVVPKHKGSRLRKMGISPYSQPQVTFYQQPVTYFTSSTSLKGSSAAPSESWDCLSSDGSQNLCSPDSAPISLNCCSSIAAQGMSSSSCLRSFAPEMEEKTSGGIREEQMTAREPKKDAKVAVGAGARIRQEVQADPLAVEDWNPEPEAIIHLYFVFRKKFEGIARKGILDLSGNSEGFLKGLPVG